MSISIVKNDCTLCRVHLTARNNLQNDGMQNIFHFVRKGVILLTLSPYFKNISNKHVIFLHYNSVMHLIEE